ncbi:MAG: selenium-dependent xanthine dehydrogenase [Clostridiaceae bacterium]
MIKFRLNGKEVSAPGELKLMTYLRDEARLTSVKNGCAKGTCGACTVVIDGKNIRACTRIVKDIEGKEVTTVEGLSDFEKKVYTDAFSKAGAVQCGFCIPGMIMSAKALIDSNPNPNPLDVKKAIKNNLCRCTGYVKIEKAILMAAEAFRENIEIKIEEEAKVGSRMVRIDAKEKVLGEAMYPDDYYMDGMLYGKALRSKYPRAKVLSIDTSKAKVLKGVHAVLTSEDIPANNYQGHIFRDWPTLIPVGEETRYVGDAIALVAAETREILEEALALIEVEYEELPAITNVHDALKEDAYKIHKDGNVLSNTYVKRGNPDEAIKNSKHVVTKSYKTMPIDHAFIEPEATIAFYEGDILTLYVSSQHIHQDHEEICYILGLPEDKVHVISAYVGGGFGGKEDLTVQHHAALLTYYTKKPTKITFSREESLMIHPKRHGMEVEITTACDEEGNLTALKAKVLADTGAYASLGSVVLQRACTHLSGPYRIPNIELDGYAIYTNNPPAGAFRGFGVPQTTFGSETNLNILAEKLGIDKWEMRYKNAVKPGDVLPTGQICDETTAIIETLEAVKDEYYSKDNKYVGIGCAMKNTGCGVGVIDTGRCNLHIKDGKVIIKTSAQCIGQGLGTVMKQICGETTGVPFELIEVHSPDTKVTPDSGPTTASRQTLITGEATRKVSLQLKEALITKTLEQLEGEVFKSEYTAVTDKLVCEKENPKQHAAYGYATQLVVLNDEGKVEKVVVAQDVGRAINPTNVEGQIEGGVVMGLGFALTEKFETENGYVKSKFGTIGLWRSTEVPKIEHTLIEKKLGELAYGAKGVGELVLIPTLSATADAYNVFDGKRRYSLPLSDTPYRKDNK